VSCVWIDGKLRRTKGADAPIIPLWQGKQIAVTHGTVNGLADTLKPDYIFRFWVLSKS